MFNILNVEQLKEHELTIKQRLRILKTRKAFAVFIDEKLYLVNDIDRLFFDRLRHENIYNAIVYQLR